MQVKVQNSAEGALLSLQLIPETNDEWKLLVAVEGSIAAGAATPGGSLFLVPRSLRLKEPPVVDIASTTPTEEK